MVIDCVKNMKWVWLRVKHRRTAGHQIFQPHVRERIFRNALCVCEIDLINSVRCERNGVSEVIRGQLSPG